MKKLTKPTIFHHGQKVSTVIDLGDMSGVSYLSAEEGHVYFHMTNGDIIDYPYPDINYESDEWVSTIDEQSGEVVWSNHIIHEPKIDNNGQRVLYITRPVNEAVNEEAAESSLRAAGSGLSIARKPQRIPLYPFTPQGSLNEVTESLYDYGGLKSLFAILQSAQLL